jgi:hypothetical protein
MSNMKYSGVSTKNPQIAAIQNTTFAKRIAPPSRSLLPLAPRFFPL